MQIHPARRRRALRVHYLQQRGHSLRKIDEQLGLSHTTVRDDLQLLESHWSSIAAPAADDLLLESLQLLQFRLALATRGDEVTRLADHLTPVEYLRARDAQDAQLTALVREIRRTVGEVHRRAEQRPDQPGLETEEAPTTADAPQPSTALQPESTTSSAEREIVEIPASEEKILPESPQPAQPNLHAEETPTPANTPEVSTALQPEPAISSAEREIVEIPAPEEKIPSNSVQLPEPPAHDALLSEVVDRFPQLQGQSEERILAFLDQFTSPNEEPIQIQTAAAG